MPMVVEGASPPSNTERLEIADTAARNVEGALVCLGFRAGQGGAHAARTMMLADLERVLDHLGEAPALVPALRRAVVEDNLLGRATMRARRDAIKHLVELYGLDDRFVLFRTLRRLWAIDEAARPALALLVAMARDAILRGAMPFVEALAPGEPFVVAELTDFLRRRGRQRFSDASIRSMARNLASTWTQSGLLVGTMRKKRVRLEARPVSVALAMFLGYVEGSRGQGLFSTRWARLFDGGEGAMRRCAIEAGRRGLVRFAAIDDVVEVSFRGWLRDGESGVDVEQDRPAA